MIVASLARTPAARLAGPILRHGIGRRSPLLIAVGLALLTRRVDDGGWGTASARHLVVLHKAGATDDVLAAAEGRAGEGFRISTLPRRQFRTLFKAVTGTTVATGITDSDYRYGVQELDGLKQEYRRMLARTLRHYRRFTGVDAFTTANVRYRAEQELAAACDELGIAFVPLHKESLSTPAQRVWIARGLAELSGPFAGRAVAVYNDDERGSMIEAGFIAPERVEVVGCPRIDVLHGVRARRLEQRASATMPAVLFSIDVEAGTWTPFDARLSTGAPRWERLAEMTEEAFIAAARRDPFRPYLIKAKLGREDQQTRRLPTDLPPNVEVLRSGLATPLMERAAVVIGFNSTVLLEAIAAGVPVVVPRYAEAADQGAEGWVLDLEGAVRQVDDPSMLPTAILEAIDEGFAKALGDAKVQVLDRYVGNADGRSGERAWAFFSAAMGAPPRAP